VARGTESEIGTERISANGYKYRKVDNGVWVLVHRLLAEEKLGRKLNENEYAAFIDGDRTNFDPQNIIVRLRGRASLRRRLAQVEARLAEMTALRDHLKQRLETQDQLDYTSANS